MKYLHPSFFSTYPQQAKILYEIRGDGEASTYFEIDADTGRLTVKSALSADSTRVLSYTIRVRAYRENDPRVEAFKEITVTVDRNPNSPRFSQRNYVFEIPENKTLGDVFGAVTATDPDLVS